LISLSFEPSMASTSSVASIQHPIPSGFTPFTTAEDVIKGIDLTGKNAIVTGGYSGIGTETTRVLAAAGASVIVPARDVARAKEALKDVKGKIEVIECDLSSHASVKAFVEAVLAKKEPLHILVNSAGIMALPEKTLDARGFESQWATNHLGHFQLTTGLLPALRAAKSARVVNVSSGAHRNSDFVFDDPNFENRAYVPWLAYGQSKTANVLFTLELDKREKKNGIRAFSVHPGVIQTNLGRHLPADFIKNSGFLDDEGKFIVEPESGFKSIPQGAATSVFGAVSPKLDGLGGVYLEDVDIAPILETDNNPMPKLGMPSIRGVRPHAITDASAERLWTFSEKSLQSH